MNPLVIQELIPVEKEMASVEGSQAKQERESRNVPVLIRVSRVYYLSSLRKCSLVINQIFSPQV